MRSDEATAAPSGVSGGHGEGEPEMKRLNAILGAAMALAVVACGGGSSGNNNGGTTTARVSQGALTEVGAGASRTVTVNGAVVDDSAATIKIDDNPSTHDALKAGMVVTVKIDDK